jgi:FKBP-type peptidyl-prolyl cis-trans isomerase SlpA
MTASDTNTSVCLVITGKLDNGEVFYTVTEKEPLWVTIGHKQLPPSLEQVVATLKPGESSKVRVPPEEGYGYRLKELVQTIDNPHLVESLKPKPGMILSLKVTRDGVEQNVPATVLEVNGSVVSVDYNHPLAGHHLNYEVRVVDVGNADRH